MWTATSRAQHNRDDLRFASDLTDAEWAVLAPLLPSPSLMGRPPTWPMRDIVEAIFYVLRGGVPWRMLPTCFPPRQTVYGWFAAFRNAGVWEAVNHLLVMRDREHGGREGADADQQFAELMMAHHEGGIEMATEAAEHAGSDEVRAMAAAIAQAQASEIAEIQGLLD